MARGKKLSQDALNTILENIADCIALIGTDGIFLSVNRSMFGISPEELVDQKTIYDIPPPDYVDLVRTTFQKVVEKGEQAEHEIPAGEAEEPKWYLVRFVPVKGKSGNVSAVVMASTDVTERKRADSALHHRIELENLIATLSTHFINLNADEIDESINGALRMLGEFIGVDRGYVFSLDYGKETITNTHEWCDEGLSPQSDNLQDLPFSRAAWWVESLRRFENIHVPRTSEMPDEISAQIEFLEAQGIKSLIAVPMVYGYEVIGCLGFDSVQKERAWSEDEVILIKVAGEIFANALQRKQITEALRESEARYRGFFENSPISFWEEDFSEVKVYIDALKSSGVSDISAYFEEHPEAVSHCASIAKVLDVNRVTLELTGAKSKAELCGRLETVFSEETLSTFQKELIALSEGETRFECEAVRRTLTGEKTEVVVNLAVAPGCEETWSKIFVSVIDVTEHKRIEKALREKESELSKAQRIANVGNWVNDLIDGELHWSDELWRIFGREKQKIMREIAFFWFHPDDRERVFAATDAYVREKDKLNIEYRIIRSDGAVRYMHSRGEVVCDEAGVPIQTVGTVQDITERKQSEQLLRGLNQAALAMGKAITPEEIFTATVEGLKELGFSCTIMPTDESQRRLFTRYLSYESKMLRTAEKLAGLKHEEFSFSIENADVFTEVVYQKKTVFLENSEDTIRQVLPPRAKRFARQLVTMLKVPKTIIAPLIADDKVIGVLTVHSDDLVHDYVPTITAFAHQVAASWHKALLFEQAQQEIAERRLAEAEREILMVALKHRNVQMETAAEVSKSTITILNPQKLMHQTAELIQERFAFYYVGVFLIDEEGEFAVLQAGTGKAGKKMLEAGHKLGVGGDSMIGQCIANSKSRISQSVDQDVAYLPNPLLPETRSEMALPLISRGRCIGALTVQSVEKDAFSEDDISVLQAMSDQVAIAIENARLFEAFEWEIAVRKQIEGKLRDRATRMELVARMGQKTTTLLEFDELLHQVVDLIGNTFGYYNVAIFLVESDKIVLKAALLPTLRPRENHVRLRIGFEGVTGMVAGSGEPLLVPDVSEYDRYYAALENMDTKSELAVPIMLKDVVIGVLDVQSAGLNAFSQSDVFTLQIIADQLAVAIENVRLYEQIWGYATELEQRVTERTAELEAVNKELEAFAYSVSHDLRAPLRAINGFSLALLEDYSGKLDDMGENYLQRVRTASQRTGTLIDDILTLSRISRGDINRETVNLSDIVQEVTAELQATEPKRQVTVIIKEGVKVEGDARLLRVMLENLLGNAWKFTGKHTRTRIEFGYTENEGETICFVRDDGAGFDMAYANKLFGAFQRLHPVAEFEGTGIGLATVQRIINRHGGRVWAEGAVGQGATFYFSL